MTKTTHPALPQAENSHREGDTARCNVFHFPTHHDRRSSPLSRYAIPPASAFLFQSLAAKRPRCAALIDELIRLDALIEAKNGSVDPAIITGMEIAHDLILLQIRAMSPATDAYAVLRRSILREYRPKTTIYGLLPELLADAWSSGAQEAVAGASDTENKA